ncbi:hypothetical protein Tco_0176475 [Tanacetum coccineum]
MPLNSGAIAILVPNTILLTWHHFFSMAREVWHDRSPGAVERWWCSNRAVVEQPSSGGRAVTVERWSSDGGAAVVVNRDGVVV